MCSEWVNVFLFKNNYFSVRNPIFWSDKPVRSLLPVAPLADIFWCTPGGQALDCPLVVRRNDCIFCGFHLPGIAFVARIEAHGALCFINCHGFIFVLNIVCWFSDFSSQDCEKPGISCLTMHCNLSALAKEESRTIDIYMLLNTEILKKVSPMELHSWGSFKRIWIGFLMKLCLPLLKLSWQVPLVILMLEDGREKY